MKGVRAAAFLVMMTAAASPRLFGEEAAQASGEAVRTGVIHRPQDVAPPELVIVPRPPEEYLPKGSLLATGARGPRQVDLDELRRRKLDMYAGKASTDSLPLAAGAVCPVASLPVPQPVRPPQRDLAALLYWSVVAGCLLGAAWLFLRVFLNLHRQKAP